MDVLPTRHPLRELQLPFSRAIVAKQMEISVDDSVEIVELTTSELVRLIEFYHPKIVEMNL